MYTLLTRDDFREGVFARDNHKCVICGSPGKDAHHIIERRLFSDGGYYLDNGATLCGDCHIAAEKTDITCEQIREAVGINQIVLPEDFYRDLRYDKWGNIYLGKLRTKGPLFNDTSVRKILAGHLGEFTDYVKYPRTFHLPWSPGITKDDRVLKDTSVFDGREVVVTEKMDGENSTLYKDYFHARSLDGKSHPSQDWLKNYHASFCFDIPEGWRICGENLYAKHSIAYDNLDSYFYAFSIWTDENVCLSWAHTQEYLALLEIPSVPVLYMGIWDEETIRSIPLDKNRQEGYVVRVADSFGYGEFKTSVAKYVRPNHVAATVHNWRRQPIVPNKLKNDSDTK